MRLAVFIFYSSDLGIDETICGVMNSKLCLLIFGRMLQKVLEKKLLVKLEGY